MKSKIAYLLAGLAGIVALTSAARAQAIYDEVNGRAVMEAEGFSIANESVWQLKTFSGAYAPPLATGGNCMQALPNSGVNLLGDATGPDLTFDINFTTTGRYYVYVRGRGPQLADNSIHLSFWTYFAPATFIKSTQNTGGISFGNQFEWRSLVDGTSKFYIDVAVPNTLSLGVHMREDGVIIDRIIVSKNPNLLAEGSTVVGPLQ